MGYIAPINHYQYQQYAERELIKKYDPYQFVPIKSIKSTVNPPKNNHSMQPIPLHQGKHLSQKKHQQICKYESEKIYSEITGKGLLYSDYA